MSKPRRRGINDSPLLHQPDSQIRAGGGSRGGGAPVRRHGPVPPAPAAAALDTNSSRYCVNDNNGHFICPVTSGSPLLGAWFTPPLTPARKKVLFCGCGLPARSITGIPHFFTVDGNTRRERASERAPGLPGGEEGELRRGRGGSVWGG